MSLDLAPEQEAALRLERLKLAQGAALDPIDLAQRYIAFIKGEPKVEQGAKS